MQKNLSPFERYVSGISRNVKGNIVAGIVILFVMIAIHLLNGCEPILPDKSPYNKESSLLPDSVNMNPDINEWNTDTTIYHSDAKPK
ncbi:hypothetical protein [Bacteroides congonensis]